MASKGKRTVWLTQSPSEGHKARASMLGQHGFHVTFFRTAQELLDSMNENRPTCVLIDSGSADHSIVVKSIEKLAQHAELSGTRFILSAVSDCPESTKAAASENFRDIIPFSLSDARWLQRFQHATSSKPIEISRPLCEISMNQMAMAYVPSRIVWISETHMRIECRGGQSVGSNLQICGEVSRALGVPYLSLTVESVHRTELMYRFSQALICTWRVPEANAEAARLTIKRQIADNPALSLRLRAFVAIANPEIRRPLVKDLNRNTFEVKVALLRSTISQELSYFSPDVVFLDEKILDTLEELDLQLMASKLSSTIQIVAYGNNLNRDELRRIFGDRKIQVEENLDAKKIQNALQYFNLRNSATHSSDPRVHILPNQPWSKAEIQMPARLTSLNPSVGKISLPFSVSPFASIRLEAPILRKSLGRAPYIKITDLVEASSANNHPTQFAHHGSFYLADVFPAEEAVLGEVLLSMTGSYYQKQFFENAASASLAAHSQIAMGQASGFGGIEASHTKAAQTEILNQSDASKKLREASFSVQSSPIASNSIQKNAKLAPAFNIRNYFDPVIIRALLVFTFAMAVVLGLLSMAMRIDPSFYQDHGKQYSDFFIRMSDPSLRPKVPAPVDDRTPSKTDN